MSGTPIDVAFHAGNRLGESPIWDHRTNRLLWVDVDAGQLWAAMIDAEPTVLFETDQRVTAVALASGSAAAPAYLVVTDHEVSRFEPDLGRTEAVARYDIDGVRFNDGAVDAAGRFWLGSMAVDHRDGRGSLYRFSGDERVEVAHDLGVSNGIAWSPDHSLMYFVDSLTRRVDVFDYSVSDGVASGRRPLVSTADLDGYPDGLTVDAAGHLWVAIWSSGAVRCYDPAGDLVRHIELPVSQPTSCGFGGPDLSTLFVTTSSAGLDDEQRRRQPLAGAVLALTDTGPGLRVPEALVSAI